MITALNSLVQPAFDYDAFYRFALSLRCVESQIFVVDLRFRAYDYCLAYVCINECAELQIRLPDSALRAHSCGFLDVSMPRRTSDCCLHKLVPYYF